MEDSSVSLDSLTGVLDNQPLVLSPQAPMGSVIAQIQARGYALIGDRSRLLGLLTAGDVRRWVAAYPSPPLGTTVQSVMTTPLVTRSLSYFSDLAQLQAFMRQCHLSHLPLLDAQGGLLGVVRPAVQPMTGVEMARQQSAPIQPSFLQLQQAQLLKQMTQSIRQSLDLPTLLQSTLEAIGRLLSVDQVILVHFHPEQKIWVHDAQYSAQPHFPQCLGASTPDPGNPLKARLKLGEVIRIDDTSTLSDPVNRQLLPDFAGAWLLVPIEINATVWGSLRLHHLSHPWHWTDEEVEAVKQVANQLALGIQQAELYRQLQSLNQHLESEVSLRTGELHTVLDTLPDYVFVLDRVDYRFLYCNDLLAQSAGFSHRSQVQGKTIFECFSDENAAYYVRQSQQVFTSGEPLHIQESFELPNETIHLDTYIIPLKDSRGSVYALVNSSRNVTELIEIRKTLMRRNDELKRAVTYEQLLNTIRNAVRSSLDEKQVLQTTVHESIKVLELLACQVSLVNVDPSQAKDLDSDLPAFQYTYTHSIPALEGVYFSLDPHIRSQLLRGETLCFSSMDPWWGSATNLMCPIQDDRLLLGCLYMMRPIQYNFDPTEIRLAQQVAAQCAIGIRQSRLYQEVQQQVSQLQELHHLKDEFIHMVSHEMRTPLTNMKMALQMLDGIPLTERQAIYFQILNDEWNRELSLVNNLLDLQALESGTRSLECRPLVLNYWIQTLLEPFYMRCQERQLEVQVDLPTELAIINTDVALLDRILSELLNNACKYTPPQERVMVSLLPTNAGIQLAVTNTGVEIPSDHLPHIFEKFHRVPSLDRYQQGGTGLGLALLKKSVELLAGQIWVKSSEGSTCFRVDLPSLN